MMIDKIDRALLKCEKGTIVAFKNVKTLDWQIGEINHLYKPNSKYNKSNKCDVSLVYRVCGECLVYFRDDINEVVILQKSKI